MQIRGPPLNGIYCHGCGCHENQRSGQNSDGSGNFSETAGYKSARRCITSVEYPIGVSLSTATGRVPSAPPPRGSVVFFSARRTLNGTTGYSLSISLTTYWRYFMLFRSSYVGVRVRPSVSMISLRTFCTTSG
ncbi:hypothetical protein RRF57_000299 [Xylaria bambusicola]|uniref:Uncharacterized protein n=1 Tax=Xylaria bambusicola TaxID=326684 RepID=A0AAN7UEB7_9PEZI